MRGTVVLVVADHAASVEAVVDELATAARELAPDGTTLSVAVVDAGSTDDSVTSARSACARHGLACSVIAASDPSAWTTQRDGFAHALAINPDSPPDFLVTLDPAGHHDARQLPDLVRAFRTRGSGLTIGSRWVAGGTAPGTPRARAVLSRLASRLVARATGLRRVRDVTTSFRVVRSDAAELIATAPATSGDYGFYCEFVAVAQAYGFSVDEVPIAFRPRFTGVSSLAVTDLTTFGRDLRRIRRRVADIRTEMAHDQAAWARRSGLLRDQAPEAGSEFGALEELTELSGAGHFNAWIVDALTAPLDDLAPTARLLEVGAGMGAIAQLLAERRPLGITTAIEPAANVFPELARRAAGVDRLDVRQVTSTELATGRERFDAVLYVNVLEHIEHDADELRTARELLEPDGRIGLFVPAMPSLYGSLDYKSGHFRRYTAERLRELLSGAGFVDVDVRHFDMVGVVPYWAMYRWLDVGRLDRVSSAAYDRVAVPISRALERIVPRPPFGKNLVASARRA